MTYKVLQGVFSNSGVGDFHLMKEFDNLDNAINYFNNIREDKQGWSINKHQHLETVLLEGDNLDDPIAWWNKD